jgi:hypothetical protein
MPRDVAGCHTTDATLLAATVCWTQRAALGTAVQYELCVRRRRGVTGSVSSLPEAAIVTGVAVAGMDERREGPPRRARVSAAF